MNATPPSGNTNFRRLSDEALIAYAHTAISIVTARSLVWLLPFVRHLLQGILKEDELADAQESAVLKLIECSHDFNPVLPGGATFKTYGKTVVRHYLFDELKRRGWLKAHSKGEEELKLALQAKADELDRAEVGLSDSHLTDPADIAVAHEACERLERAVEPLHPLAWPLWQEISTGAPLSEAARTVGIDYPLALHLRGLIYGKVQEVLGEDRM